MKNLVETHTIENFTGFETGEEVEIKVGHSFVKAVVTGFVSVKCLVETMNYGGQNLNWVGNKNVVVKMENGQEVNVSVDSIYATQKTGISLEDYI